MIASLLKESLANSLNEKTANQDLAFPDKKRMVPRVNAPLMEFWHAFF